MVVICPRIDDGAAVFTFEPAWQEGIACTGCGHEVAVALETLRLALRRDGAAEIRCLECEMAAAGVGVAPGSRR